MSYIEELNKLGIDATKTGKYTCPSCSKERKNKNDKCLSVTYQSDRVIYKCHHCDDFTGVVFFNKFISKKQFTRPEEPKSKDCKQALYSYFEKRGISKEVVDYFKVDLNKNNEIMFKYYKDNELVNIKYRKNLGNGKKQFRQEKDSEKTFFGMDLITDFSELIIVEGEIGCLTWAEVGLFNVVSVPQGASEKKLECIENCYEWLEKFDNIVIAVDTDEAGDKLKANLLSRLDKSKCRIVTFGEHKDENEVLLKEGKNKLIECFINARFVRLEGVTDFLNQEEAILNFHKNGFQRGLSTGWSNLDELFTIKTGYLMIVTGMPTRGKSFVVDNLLMNLSINSGWKHFVCSFETSHENHFSRFVQFKTRKKFSSLSTEEVKNEIRDINDFVYRLEINKPWTIEEIIEQIRIMKRRYGIKTVTIDPYNRLNHVYKDREDKYINSMLTKLSMLCKELDILIIFIAHPAKPPKGDTSIPTMYSISGSSDWYNQADYGIVIHRDKDINTQKLENKVHVVVHKVKDEHLGNPSGGTAYLQYNHNIFNLENYIGSTGNSLF